MKFIFNNIYISVDGFDSFKKFSSFMARQSGKKIHLKESFGDKYYCFLLNDSLSQKSKFIVSFESNNNEDELTVLYWESERLIAFYTGSYLYFLDHGMNIRFSIELSTALIGLHATGDKNLLVLEEASASLINSSGAVLKKETFDFIDNFSIEGDQLFFEIEGEMQVFDLNFANVNRKNKS